MSILYAPLFSGKARLRMTFRRKVDGELFGGRNPTLASDVFVSVDDGAWTAATGTWIEPGGAGNGRGYCTYETTALEIAGAKHVSVHVEGNGTWYESGAQAFLAFAEGDDIAKAVWNVLVSNLGALPVGSVAESVIRPFGAVAADGSNTATTFKTTLTGATANHLKDGWISFIDGALATQVHKVLSSTTTGFVTMVNPFTATPTADDRFVFVNK